MKLGNLSQSLPTVLVSVRFLLLQSYKNTKVKAHSEYHNVSTRLRCFIPQIKGILGIWKTSQNCKKSIYSELNQLYFIVRSNYL